MKKFYKFLICLLLILNIIPVLAQTSLTASDSVSSISVSKLDTSRRKQLSNNFISNIIPVKAGDSISITAVIQYNKQKGHFLQNIAKAVIPSVVLNRLNRGRLAGPVEQGTTDNTVSFGATLTIVPASIELLQNQYKSKTFIALRAYDENNQQVTVISDLMTKAARRDWQELKVNYRVEKDGYVEIIGSKDEKLSFLNFGQKNWLQVSKYSNFASIVDKKIANSTSIPNARISAPSDGSSSNVPPVETNGYSCTAWYWCDGFGCSFIGITCQEAIDFGEDPGGMGGGDYVPEDQACAKCKLKAQNEHDDNLTLAKSTLYTSVIGGCTYAGVQTYISFNAAGWWVNIVPGIGPAAIQALSMIGGLAVDITCLVTAVQIYNAAESTIENNYYKDMRDCAEKYKNCN